MDRSTIVLAAMAPGEGYRYTPVQLQKLLFLIDREIPELVEGPHFNFQPYHYGPFDKGVYQTLDVLADDGMVDVDEEFSRRRTYALTPNGRERGQVALDSLTTSAQTFINKSCAFVRDNGFSALVSAIYKAYPEMRENSVFQQ